MIKDHPTFSFSGSGFDSDKQAPYGADSWLRIRGKICLLKLEHPTFEGHVMLNKDEYQKSVRLKFRYYLGVS